MYMVYGILTVNRGESIMDIKEEDILHTCESVMEGGEVVTITIYNTPMGVCKVLTNSAGEILSDEDVPDVVMDAFLVESETDI